jgi:hypothetical protein
MDVAFSACRYRPGESLQVEDTCFGVCHLHQYRDIGDVDNTIPLPDYSGNGGMVIVTSKS